MDRNVKWYRQTGQKAKNFDTEVSKVGRFSRRNLMNFSWLIPTAPVNITQFELDFC